MRYHYEKPIEYVVEHAKTYDCNHPVYNRCTLYLDGKRGLAVIQQRYEPFTKKTWWTEIDPWLIEDLYSHPRFQEVFDKYANDPNANDIYPTITIRQLMWNLKMKPLKRELWETCFDKSPF